MTDESLREPVHARGHRVAAHLCAELEQLLLRFAYPEGVPRPLINGMLHRAHAAAVKDADDQAAAERDTATLFERVLAQ